jgi:two-component system sensor kinase FixL
VELAVARAEDGDTPFTGFMRDLTAIEAERRKVEAAHAELLHVARLSDMGEVAAARRSLETAPDAPIASGVGLIEAQARQAVDILRRLRGFIEKRESRRYPENLTKLVQDALALASVRVNDRLVRIVQKLSPDDIDVDVDRVQILQVLVNFLRNAADAMASHDDPEIIIATLPAARGLVQVKVSDNGPGLDPTVTEKLFTPFVTTKTQGMGVGLSLCKTIIQSHGGHIGCGPNDPRGAMFWFTLPVVARSDAEASPIEAATDP